MPTIFTQSKSKAMRLVLFLLLTTQILFSQPKLKGRVNSDQGELSGVFIVNRTQMTTTTSSQGGIFEIEANTNDVLVVTSLRIEPLEIKLNANSFKQNPLELYVKVKPLELEEIVVRNITTKSLRIVPKHIKEYTPAERRLHTASHGGPVGMISNWITGNKKNLQKGVEYEKYETDVQKLLYLLTEDFFLHTLKINEEDKNGFLVLASENTEIARLLLEKNIALLKLRLVELSFKFKELKNEK